MSGLFIALIVPILLVFLSKQNKIYLHRVDSITFFIVGIIQIIVGSFIVMSFAWGGGTNNRITGYAYSGLSMLLIEGIGYGVSNAILSHD